MKLKNKKTTEIGTLVAYDPDKGIFAVKIQSGDRCYYYSLAALHEVWEDYEEPIEYWYIEEDGDVIEMVYQEDNVFDQKRRRIGNYFSSREEAEKAVKKLKAFKRLKDKGLRFERWGIGGEYGNTITFSDYIEYNDETRADLDLLFGGEE